MANRGKRGSVPTVVDPGLLPKIRQYLEDHPSEDQVYADDVVEYLQKSFPQQYSRKTFGALRAAVEKALLHISNQSKPPKEKELRESRDRDREKERAKESEPESDPEGPNLMNAAIRENYKRANPASPASPRIKKRPKTDHNVDKRSHYVRPSARFSHLGGIESILQDIREIVERPILHPEIYLHLGIQPPCGVLLHGPSGCGKTLLAHAIAGELGVPFLKISAPEIVSGVSGESEAKLRTIFLEAMTVAPSIIFIDEIDAITPKRGNASREMERRIVAQLLTLMDDLSLDKTDGKAVVVIGATNRPDSLDQALRRSGRFDREICLGVPDEAARSRILETLTKSLRMDGKFDFVALAKKTPGFVGADLQALIKEAATIAINRSFKMLETIPRNSDSALAEPMSVDDDSTRSRSSTNDAIASRDVFSEKELEPLCITMGDFENALPTVQPSATREGFATIPDVTWDQVGSLQDIREELEMSLLAPIKHREKFNQIGLKSTSCGVLLYGPPGCGKTLVAKAMANQAHLNFISVKGPELLNKYVGESERAVRQTFSRARASAPCIIFFDELDGLVPKRESTENQVTQRVVNQMLTEMDGLDARKEIFIIAASNRPDMIDPAILRPGRLDKLIYLPIPTPEDRIQILQTCARKTPLAEDVDLKGIALDPRTTGYSGADLALLHREAQGECIRLSIEKNEQLRVCKNHYEVALTKVLPSITQQDERRYNSLNKNIIHSRTRLQDDPKKIESENQKKQ